MFSDWMTGTLSDEGWGPRDDKIVQFASHYFLYFPIFHLKYSYIFLYFVLQNSYIPIFCEKKSLGALYYTISEKAIRFRHPDYDLDRAQKLVSSFTSRHLSTRDISSKSMHVFLVILHTDKRTRARGRKHIPHDDRNFVTRQLFKDLYWHYVYIYIYLSCVLSTVFFTVLMNEWILRSLSEVNYSAPVNLLICARYYTTTPLHALYARLIIFLRRAAIFHWIWQKIV